jgi:hypothetical protein
VLAERLQKGSLWELKLYQPPNHFPKGKHRFEKRIKEEKAPQPPNRGL